MGFENIDYIGSVAKVQEFVGIVHSSILDDKKAKALKLVYMKPFFWYGNLSASTQLTFSASDLTELFILRNPELITRDQITVNVSDFLNLGAHPDIVLDYKDEITEGIPKPKLVFTRPDGTQIRISTFGELEIREEEYVIQPNMIGVRVEETGKADEIVTFPELLSVPKFLVLK